LERPDFMMSLVERRTNKIVHAGIDDHECLSVAALHINHTGYQNTGIADEDATWLENQGAVEIPRRPLDHVGIGLRMGRWLVVVAIGNAETATKIDVLDHVPVPAQRPHEIRQ